MRTMRANTIPETAFVISLVLTTLFGVMQYALLGFNQVSADGATFVGDHSAVAYYGSPNSANANYVQQAATAVFQHSGGTYAATVPRNGAYQVDFSGGRAYTNPDYVAPFQSILPATLTTTSHQIEPSSSTASQSPLGGCAQGVMNTANGTITSVTGPSIGLLQKVTAPGLFNVGGDGNGKTAITLNAPVLQSTEGALAQVGQDYQNLQATLATLSSLLDPSTGTLSIIPGEPALEGAISAQISTLLSQALNGSMTSGSLTTAQNTINGLLTNPIIKAAVNTLLATVYAGLNTLNNDVNALNNIDKLAPTSC